MMKLIKFTVIILALHIVSINASAQGFLDNLLGNAAKTLNNLNEQRISKPVKGLMRKLTMLKGKFYFLSFSGEHNQTIYR